MTTFPTRSSTNYHAKTMSTNQIYPKNPAKSTIRQSPDRQKNAAKNRSEIRDQVALLGGFRIPSTWKSFNPPFKTYAS